MENNTLAQLEASIAQNKEQAELKNAVIRLSTNRDFKKVILEGYFEKEAIRLVHARSSAAMQTPDKQQRILDQMDAISNLRDYLDTVVQMGELAEKFIIDSVESRDLYLAEDE